MDDALRLLASARDQVGRAELLLATADGAAWVGPSATAYRARLDERRAACATLRDLIDHAYARAAAVGAAA